MLLSLIPAHLLLIWCWWLFSGDAGVGKSSLAAMFVTQKFTPHNESTIGANFLSKQVLNFVLHHNVDCYLHIGSIPYWRFT